MTLQEQFQIITLALHSANKQYSYMIKYSKIGICMHAIDRSRKVVAIITEMNLNHDNYCCRRGYLEFNSFNLEL